jgi:DNA-binding CsgD family transcriptional regulator
MWPLQEDLIKFDPPPSGIVWVNHHVYFSTEERERVIIVHGVAFAHYDVSDRAAQAYAMVSLFESGYANQKSIARAFGVSARSLCRYQERLEAGGLAALARADGRPSASRSDPPKKRERDRTVLHLKAKGFSNRAIAGKLGLDEKAIRKRLHLLGWAPCPEPSFAFHEEAGIPVKFDTDASEQSQKNTAGSATKRRAKISNAELEPAAVPSRDLNPLDRSMDRLLAAMGWLEDAAPMFACAPSIPRAGVLLAIPSLVASGLLPVARKIYGTIGPAFYGLRTTLVTYVLLALLRVPRPETLKEHAPNDLGRIVGLDRMPEVKTLRRKLARLASLKGSQQLGREMARQRIRRCGRVLGFLYLDGHVRAYHGKRTIAKGYDTRIRLAVPATTDYWVNDKKGAPLFVVTAVANCAMTKMLTPILEQVRELIGSDRRITITFDRAGWSQKLFCKLLTMGFDILTYRKGRVRHIAEKRFVLRKARLDGRPVKYLLHDQAVRFLKGQLRLRQVTRLTEDGHQTAIVTSRWDLRDIVVAYRMFERWRQENFFKYMREEFLIDALVDYDVEPDDPTRFIPNPARKEVDKELRAARAKLARLQEGYGTTALDYLDGRSPTMRVFTAAEKQIRKEIADVGDHIAKLLVQRKSLPVRVQLAQTAKGAETVKLSTESKHLTNVLKMVAYQIESDMVEQIRPHYARIEDEGRTLIQTALQSSAEIAPAGKELRIKIAPLSSPHRSLAIAALCETLNQTNTPFPGTCLVMRFSVQKPVSDAKSGQVS